MATPTRRTPRPSRSARESRDRFQRHPPPHRSTRAWYGHVAIRRSVPMGAICCSRPARRASPTFISIRSMRKRRRARWTRRRRRTRRGRRARRAPADDHARREDAPALFGGFARSLLPGRRARAIHRHRQSPGPRGERGRRNGHRFPEGKDGGVRRGVGRPARQLLRSEISRRRLECRAQDLCAADRRLPHAR